MAGIRASAFIKPEAPATVKDRERLDFSRYANKPQDKQPTKRIPFTVLLSVASHICGRPITELTQLSSGEIGKIRRRLRDASH